MSKVEVLTDKARKTYKNEEKEQILADLEQSGEKITDFCKKNKIAYSTMNKWIKEKEKGILNPQIKSLTTSVVGNVSPFNLPSIQNDKLQQLTNENMLLTQQNQWLKTELERTQRTLGKLVVNSEKLTWETETKKAG